MAATSFWRSLGDDVFEATELTQGPWSPEHQHGGPPGALLVRQLEALPAADGLRLGRISFDLLGPIPIAVLTARARVLRDGRRIQLVEATLADGDRALMRATAWRIRAVAAETPPAEAPEPPPFPDTAIDPTASTAWRFGYLEACEWRFARGGLDEPGPGVAWNRLLFPVVDDEPPSGLMRLVAAADSANGISAPLPIREWRFVPPELTVHVLREPAGEWIAIDAATQLGPEGGGLAVGQLFDRGGLVGRSTQALLVERAGG